MFKNRQTLLLLGDVAVLALSLWLMILWRFDASSQHALIMAQIRIFVPLFVLWLVVFFVFELYDVRRVNPNPQHIGLLIAAVALCVGLSIVVFYLIPQPGITPKTNLAIIGGIAFMLLVAWRRAFYHLFTSRIKQHIALIGTSPLLDDLKTELTKHPQLGTVVGHWEDISQIPSDIGTIHLFISESTKPKYLLSLTQHFNATLFSLPHAYQAFFGKVPASLISNERAIQIISKDPNQAMYILSRIIEILVATIVLVITSPFVLIAMIAILVEDGSPVIYRQARVGKNGAVFDLYKLRSMRKDAERNGAQWADTHDTRITRLGHILRKTHLDEVPQMYNIIRGNLALIGPRPERPEFVTELEQQIPYYYLRHTVRPGFTGWAQIKFRYARSVMDSQEKFAYDLYYLLNRSPLLDAGIVLKTLQIIFTH